MSNGKTIGEKVWLNHQYGKLNTAPTTYSFDFTVDLILADQIDKLWDLELDMKVRFRSIERFQRFDYFNAVKS